MCDTRGTFVDFAMIGSVVPAFTFTPSRLNAITCISYKDVCAIDLKCLSQIVASIITM